MKKTTIRSALAVLLAASTLTACGGSAASSAPASAAASSTAVAPAKQYTIGIAEAQANDETTVRRAYLENYIGPAYNVKFIFSEVLKDDAATKTFIENCADNDMVYAISGNYIAHPEFLETDYPNFAGAVGSNNAELGSLFGTWLKDNVEADGTEGYLIATGIASSGNQQHIEIGQGILNGIADKYGLTFEQDIADLVTVAETTNAANDKGILVTLYPGSPNKETWLPGVSALIQTGQYNTFLSAGQTYNQSATVVDEVEKSFGIDIKVASVGALGQTLTTAFNTKDPFGNPSIDLATVKSTSVLTSALFAITYNALNGDVQTACRGTDGKPLYFEFANMSVTSAEQLAQMDGWDDASTGNWCATTDVVDGMLTIVNPDLTAEEINTYLGTLDFETLKSMMG